MNRAILACAAALAVLVACRGPTSPPVAQGAAARPLPEIYAAIRALAATYPGIASASVLGCAASEAYPKGGDPDLPLLALEIRAAPEGSPSVQVVGAMHGDEQIGAELALAVARQLCESYSSADGSAAAKLVASAALTFLPVANPWGYRADSRCQASGRDLNRNFDWAWAYGDISTNKGEAALDAPEAALLVADACAKHYALAVTLHSGSYRITLPWDYLATSGVDPATYTYGDFIAKYAPAYGLFEARGAAYAASVNSAASPSSDPFIMSEGCDWYIVCGSYADWLYGKQGSPCYTVELSPNFSWTKLGADYGSAVIAAHKGALIDLLSSAGMGASGRVKDAFGALLEGATVTAVPIAAARELVPPKDFRAFALSDAKGRFHIALPQGSWSLRASYGGIDSPSQTIAVGSDGYSTTAAILTVP